MRLKDQSLIIWLAVIIVVGMALLLGGQSCSGPPLDQYQQTVLDFMDEEITSEKDPVRSYSITAWYPTEKGFHKDTGMQVHHVRVRVVIYNKTSGLRVPMDSHYIVREGKVMGIGLIPPQLFEERIKPQYDWEE